MKFVDTSAVVRYLTGEPETMAEAAATLLDSEEVLVLTPTVLLETAHVLRSVYGIARETIVEALTTLIQKRNLSVWGISKVIAVQALALCKPSGRVSFGDALLWAAAREAEKAAKTQSVVLTFDEKFPSEGIEVSIPKTEAT